MTLLRLTDMTVLRQSCPVVDKASLKIGPGEVIGLIGPNGAGKTTLLRAALGLLPCQGHASLAEMPVAARARHAAWMPQAREIAWPVTVETLVMLGRVPHLAGGAKPSDADRAAVAGAIAAMGLAGFEMRRATELSGGEQARVLIARVLAQDAPLILADEPVAGLDPGHQITTMEVFARAAANGKSVLVSLHDLGLAARYCTRLILLHQGRVVADDRPDAVLTPENLADVFGISAHMERTAQGVIFQPLSVLS